MFLCRIICAYSRTLSAAASYFFDDACIALALKMASKHHGRDIGAVSPLAALQAVSIKGSGRRVGRCAGAAPRSKARLGGSRIRGEILYMSSGASRACVGASADDAGAALVSSAASPGNNDERAGGKNSLEAPFWRQRKSRRCAKINRWCLRLLLWRAHRHRGRQARVSGGAPRK